MMRFKDNEPNGVPVHARVANVSETGLSLVVESHEIPYTGELLKIEFTIPGKQQIACFAQVVRVEPVKRWHPEHGDKFAVRIAVSFHEMPFIYRKALQKSLKERVHAEEDFDDAGEISVVTRAIHFSIATLGLLVLFLTMQVAPVQLLEMITKI